MKLQARVMRHPSRALSHLAVLLLAGTAITGLPAAAMAADWTGGAGTGNWYTGGNWSTNATPTNGVNTVIDTTTALNPVQIDGGAASSTSLVVGAAGTGGLSISDGAVMSLVDFVIIGDQAGASGTITVTGAGSKLSTTDDLYAGNVGDGVLMVEQGGEVDVSELFITIKGDADGAVTVDGTDSLLTTHQFMSVGGGTAGNATGKLTISHGGTVHNIGDVKVGLGGNTGTVLVDGAGSSWNVDNLMTVGDVASTGTVTIKNQGQAEADSIIAGNMADATGKITVTGAHSSLTVDHELKVGSDGSGTLNVEDGAVVNVGDLIAAWDTDSDGTITVTGAGSSLTASQYVLIGESGEGKLSILDGGKVEDQDGLIGTDMGNGDVKVDGAGSLWNNHASLDIGDHGAGKLTISNGGEVDSGDTHLGNDSTVTGTGFVTGAGSKWTVAGELKVGNLGGGALSITDGAAVTSHLTVIGAQAGSNGTASVAVGGAKWTADQMIIGDAGIGALTLSSGGSLDAAGGIVIANAAGSTGTLNISSNPSASAAGALTAPTVTFGAGTGTINFNHTDTNYVFSAEISGHGEITQLSGVTRLTGNSSGFTGPTVMSGGTLLVDGTLGGNVVNVLGGKLGGAGAIEAQVSIGLAGTLIGQQGQRLDMLDLTLAGGSHIDVDLSDANATAMFSVTNDLVLDGTLDIATVNGFGAGVYRLIDYGGTLVDHGLDIGTTPVGSAAGDFTIDTTLAGQVDLIAANDVSGVLQFWDGDAAGNAQNGTVDGGAGVWSASSANWTTANGAHNGAMLPKPGYAIFEGAAGTITVDDSAGAVGVTGMQFASDGFAVSGNAVELANADTVIRVGDGSAAGADYNATINSALVGAGGLHKTDLGNLVLAGLNTYTGGTTITDGAVFGSATSFGTGDIDDDGTLVIDQAANADFANNIDGFGRLVKDGAGSLNLTGTSGFGGTTTIAAGRLAVNGSLENSAITVMDGGTLGGNGTVGAVDVKSGGTVGPGNSIGMLTVDGDYDQAAGSIYQVELTTTGQADRINASGMATIADGAVLDVVKTDAGPYVLGTHYTVLTATGGVHGTYDLTGDLTAFYSLVADYDANDVYLDVVQKQSFADAGTTPNQIATGGGLDSLPSGNAIANVVANLSSNDAADRALDQLSGEVHASVKTAEIDDSRFVREATLGRLQTATEGSGIWGSSFGSWGEVKGDGNAATITRNISGFLAGADTTIGDNWRVGVEGGYSGSSLNIGERNSSASSDDYHLGLYGGTNWGNVAFRSGLAYSWHDLSITRAPSLAGFSENLAGTYHAGTTQAFGELGYDLTLGDLALEPFANLAHVDLATDGFAEKGGDAALSGAGGDTNVTFTTLGLRASTHFVLGTGIEATIRAAVGWQHAFGDTTPISTLAFSGGAPFTIAGVPITRDAATIDLSADLNLTTMATLGLSYSGQFGSGLNDQSLRGTLAVKF